MIGKPSSGLSNLFVNSLVTVLGYLRGMCKMARIISKNITTIKISGFKQVIGILTVSSAMDGFMSLFFGSPKDHKRRTHKRLPKG